jgi:hypothetical protein
MPCVVRLPEADSPLVARYSAELGIRLSRWELLLLHPHTGVEYARYTSLPKAYENLYIHSPEYLLDFMSNGGNLNV